MCDLPSGTLTFSARSGPIFVKNRRNPYGISLLPVMLTPLCTKVGLEMPFFPGFSMNLWMTFQALLESSLTSARRRAKNDLFRSFLSWLTSDVKPFSLSVSFWSSPPLRWRENNKFFSFTLLKKASSHSHGFNRSIFFIFFFISGKHTL